mmetsp:Transcript_7159/g.11243  ORF Transcript_7159/g.11243 Transcript_7159/m.11243 type:complete len:107 (+) Transcript_7159:28-348(+)
MFRTHQPFGSRVAHSAFRIQEQRSSTVIDLYEQLLLHCDGQRSVIFPAVPACVPILSGPSVFFSRMSLRLAGRGVRYNMLFEKRHKHIVICISVEILRGRTPAAER